MKLKIFITILVILSCVSLGFMISSYKGQTTENTGKSVQSEFVIKEELAHPGEWTKAAAPKEVYSVSNVDDLEQRTCSVDPFTKKKTYLVKPVTVQNIKTDWTVESIQFMSKKNALRFKRKVFTP